jgi:hypothetical protein
MRFHDLARLMQYSFLHHHINQKERKMKKQWMAAAAVGAAVLFSSCANNPTGLNKLKTGSLEIWASLMKPAAQNVLAKTQATQATTWDSLVVRISASDMDTMLMTFKFNSLDPYISAPVGNLPAGKNRCIEVFTKTKNNVIIHVSANQIINISASEKKALDFRLVPVKGSIYIDLSNIPTSVKRICAAFGGFSSCEDRSTKLFISIDNIPDKTSDSLIMEGTDTAGTTVYRSSLWLVFSVTRDTSVSSSFYRVTTGASLNVTAQIPASTVVSGNVGSVKTIAFETGRLLITEIMYAANDSEYVEIFNPSDTAFNDSLILEIDGTCRSFGIVAVAANSYFVIGRKNLPWTDTYNTVSTALDLSSGGNWCSLRTKAAGDTVLDWVAFTGGSNAQEWPNLGSAKKSIVVDSLVSDPTYNNYGHNWGAAQTQIKQLFSSAVTEQYGTPKSKDL